MEFHDGRVVLHIGDCFDVLDTLPENSVAAVVSDPPYALVSIVNRFSKTSENDENITANRCKTRADGYARFARGFMGKEWDNGQVAFNPELWAKVYRVLKPGGHMVAFGGTRTFHRLVCAVEDAGFEIRDSLAWITGQGFPKSHDISKAIDKNNGIWRGRCGRVIIEKQVAKGKEYERNEKGNACTVEPQQYSGFGTALKPSMELITLCRKPLSEPTIAANVLKWGCGGLNIGKTRIGDELLPELKAGQARLGTFERENMVTPERFGRWPSNVTHDGSDEVLALFPESSSTGKYHDTETVERSYKGTVFGKRPEARDNTYANDSGSAARFFYTAKASELDRIGSLHPTVKPVLLMRWLVRLITPPNGTVLDMFAGTGTTGQAAMLEGFKSVLIEREVEYVEDIERRMKLVFEKTPLKREKGSADGATLF